MQWVTSPPVSLARVMLPYALRDPYRLSHFTSELYAQLWPDAKAYLINLNNSANVGLLDPIMPGAQDYFLSLDRMATAVWAGADPQEALKPPPRSGTTPPTGSASTRRRRSTPSS